MKPRFTNKANGYVSGLDGEKTLLSRSVAIIVIPFFYTDGLTYIPLGLKVSPKQWGLTSGFLEWGESIDECVRRRFLGDTGIDLAQYAEVPSQPDWIDSTPIGGEHIVFRFVISINVDDLPPLQPQGGDVLEASWFDVSWDGTKGLADREPFEGKNLEPKHSELIQWGMTQ